MKISTLSDLGALIPKPFIERSLHKDLERALKSKEVIVLYGARQVGKSSEVMYLIKKLLSGGKKQDIFYFNLDLIIEDFKSPDRFIASLMAQRSHPDNFVYVFLDEAQRLPNVGLFIKYIYDQKLPIKFFLTGSASLDIREKIKEPLTGRKQEFCLESLNLAEILQYRGINLKNPIQNSFGLIEEILEEYLLFGGYPEIVVAVSYEQKRKKLLEIAESYILRDIKELFDIKNTDNLQLVSSFIAENIGNLLSKDNISNLAAVSKYEIEKCLDALQKTFVICLLKPFAKNVTKELIHRPKMYFHDLGIRNAILRKLEPHMIIADKGKLFENAIEIQLSSIFPRRFIGFWRTINKTEIDFVVRDEAGLLDVFETKYSWESPGLPRNLGSFIATYKDLVKSAQVISKENFWRIFQE